MIDIITALKARLPFIGVRTDDIVNVRAVLQAIAGKTIQPLPTAQNHQPGDAYVYWTDDPKAITVDMYRRLSNAGATAIVINPDLNGKASLVYDAGPLPTPDSFYVTYLKEFVAPEALPALVHVLKGLSL
jgi:hypothetical protein